MKALISLLFLIVANVSFAEDIRYYDVEVVIIENLSETAKNSENWPLQVNLELPEKIVKLGQPTPKLSEWLPAKFDIKESYKLLSPKTYKLTAHIKKISESKTKRVIFHAAWRQPGLDKHKSFPVYFKREVPAPPVIDEEGSDVEPQQSDSTPSVLDGILRVTLARYLHLEAELSYRKKLPKITDSDNPFSVFDNEEAVGDIEKQGIIHLKQKRRRIRSNELHYLDHPVLSILVQMTPYEKPEELAATPKKK